MLGCSLLNSLIRFSATDLLGEYPHQSKVPESADSFLGALEPPQPVRAIAAAATAARAIRPVRLFLKVNNSVSFDATRVHEPGFSGKRGELMMSVRRVFTAVNESCGAYLSRRLSTAWLSTEKL